MKKIILLLSILVLTQNVKSQNELWGMTWEGGDQSNYGIIFKTASDGTNFNAVKSFSLDYPGSTPRKEKLCKADNGKLYGMTFGGGANGFGVIFEFDPSTQSYIKKIDFSGVANGRHPEGGLIQASNGKLYGMTNQGGANGVGALIEYNFTVNTCVIKYSFGGTNGQQPHGSLIQAANGKLYGMVTSGGVNNKGVLFEFDINTDVYSKKIDFVGLANGESPLGDLTEGSNGNLYGMLSGGPNGYGVLFEYNYSSNSLLKKFDFTSVGGYGPSGSVIELNGQLYGTTVYGGTDNKGVIFSYDLLTDTYSKLVDFSGMPNGSYPYGDLALAPSGKLYGMTDQGGAYNYGVLFEYDPNTTIYSTKFEFNQLDGTNSRSTLVLDNSGKFYGLASYGGPYNGGVIFEYDPTTNVYYRSILLNGNNGARPMGGLIKAGNGKLYGMTSEGGRNNKGVIFEFDPVSNIYLKKVDFGGINGANPYGTLFEASNGKLYGMTSYGGINNKGVLFEFDPNTAILINRVDFSGTVNGEMPYGNLMQASNGMLYGMTQYGGTLGKGTLFEFDITTNIIVKRVDFNGTANGYQPTGSLVQANNNKLYGMTSRGGPNNLGTLFEYNLVTNTYIKKLDFVGASNGANPYGNLINTSSGKLYGITYTGGIGPGVIFEYDPNTDIFVKKLDFSIVMGGQSYGSLTQTLNGKLYGMYTVKQGVFRGGIFEYDPVSQIHNIKTNFVGTPANSPYYSALLGICTPPSAPTGSVIQNFCAGSAVSDLVVNGLSINWYNTLTSTVAISPTLTLINGNHYFASQTNGCESNNRLDVLVNVSPLPIISITNATICLSQSVTLAPTGASTYTYSSGSNIVNPSASTTYTIIGTDLNNCSNTQTVSVTVNPIPSITVSDGTVCANQNYTILPSGANSYSYSGGSNIVSPLTSTIYTVTGIDLNGCSNTQTISLTVNPLPAITTNSGSICVGETFSLISSGAVNYTYSGGSDLVSPISNTTYTVVGTDVNGCAGSAISSVTVNALPVLTIASTGSVCSGSSTNIVVNGADTYLWSNSTTTSSIAITPTITETYSVTGTDVNNCSITQTVSIVVDNTCADVWPGDANSDGTADNLDVLELGLHYLQTGPARSTTSNTWQAYFANNWTGTITNGKNLNHSDCNGDGTINDDDTLSIYNNYALTHAFKPVQTTTVNPQLSIVPDQSGVVKGSWGTASVYIGDATNPINNINGLAFTVDFDHTLIETNSIYLEYQNSFIDAGQNLHFRKLDFGSGKIFTATTHTVSNNVSGYGKIATLHYKIKSSITSDQVLNVGLTQANLSNAAGNVIPLTSGTGTLLAIGASVGLQELNSNIISLSPNPTNGELKVHSKTELQKMEVVSITGQVLLAEVPTDNIHTLHLGNFSNGIYFVHLYQNDCIIKREKVILNK